MNGLKNSGPSCLKTHLILTMAVYLFLGGVHAVYSKVMKYPLLTKTQKAEIILFGQITVLRPSSIVVEVNEIIKGQLSDPEIEVEWQRRDTMEIPAPKHGVGDQILLFTNPTEGIYVPFGGPQGSMKVDQESADLYRTTIKIIMNYGESGTVKEREAILIKMLSSSNLYSQESALRILNYSQDLHTDAILESVLSFLRESDLPLNGLAMQVVDNYPNTTSIPILIDLLASSRAYVAKNAISSLIFKTRIDIPVDVDLPPEKRKAQIDKWKAWWNENKDKYQ